MKALTQGENVALSQAGISGNNIFSGISWTVTGYEQVDIDVCAFLLNSQEKVSDDGDFVFYNQKEDTARSILLNTEPENGHDIQLFSIKLDKIPTHVKKIVFVATIDKASERSQNFRDISDICIRIFELDAFDEKMVTFKPIQPNKETSIALGELYLHQSNWKFRGLGQGFESGLEALTLRYGVNTNSETSQPSDEQYSINSNNSERFIDQALIEKETHINKQLTGIIPKIRTAVEQRINESNTRMILDHIFIEIFGYRIEEVKAEVKIQGRRADYVLAVDDKDFIVVEVKKAGMPLKEEHIFQACSYAAYAGLKFVLLTNLSEYILFKVQAKDIVENDAIFSVDLLGDFDIRDIKNLTLISRYGMTKSELLENLSDQIIASSPSNISSLLLSNEVIDKLREIIKREQNCDVSQEQVQETIELILGI
ncbi:TerD family protein [uncultured Thiodictyon sp.]|uniref:TerD family protein n=1 Tax=uncultured Thiodictyon sp. TaxID=1846217 RepID=UPI0025E41D73|nr:TerD family protein [uncultured Thiodictyon sp.]